MNLDLESLTEEDLINLQGQVIKKLNDLKNQKRLQKISQFKRGDTVSFIEEGQKEEGLIIRINQETVSVITANYKKWRVLPNFLTKEQRPGKEIRTLQLKLFAKR